MRRHHFPKQENINPCKVLVLSYARPSPTFEPDRVPHYVIEYVLISKFVRNVTLKCQTENVLEQGKR